MIVLDILAFIFAIGLIILVHEAGHFYFAKKAGILCYEFSIGMGPVLYQWRKGETTISIRWIPIGGYVSMASDNPYLEEIKEGSTLGINLQEGCVKELIFDESMPYDIQGTVVSSELKGEHGEDLEVVLEVDGQIKTYPVLRDAFYVYNSKQKIQITPYDRSFDSKSIPKRLITISAGVIMNFILAILIYLIYFFVIGVPNYDSTVIGSVSEDYPASSVLVAGDEIKSVNGTQVSSWTEFSKKMNDLALEGCTTVSMEYVRDGETLNSQIENYLVINNIGLSNLERPENVESNLGVVMGKVSLKYESSVSDSTDLLSCGDILKAIRVDVYSKEKKEYVTSSFIEVHSWEDITKALNVDVAHVYFQYYNYNEQTKTYSDELTTSNVAVTLYSDEVLDAQNVAKFQIIVGVSPVYHFSFGGCIAAAFKEFWSSFTLVFRTLKALIAPSSNVHTIGLSSLSGVVGIFSMVKMYLAAGFMAFLSLIALLSVNVGVMNLLPIPALDGGRIVFLIYEAITKKKPNKKVEAVLTNIVYILLIGLFIYVTYHDILRLFTK